LLEWYEPNEFEGVKYRLLKPIDLAENPGKLYPLILSLHGAAGRGDDTIRNQRAGKRRRGTGGVEDAIHLDIGDVKLQSVSGCLPGKKGIPSITGYPRRGKRMRVKVRFSR
jgi:hypothetical protein